MTLYEELTAAGIETDHYASDLYFPATPEARHILDKHPDQLKLATGFVESKTGRGEYWIQVPFAYDPHWRR